MGNQQSTGAKKEKEDDINAPLAEYVNTIASKLIREQSFRDMKNLIDSKKCDNLVIITADIFEKYFTGNQVTYLDHRIKEGMIDNNEDSALNEEEVLYFKKEKLRDIDVDTRDEKGSIGFKKRRICIGLAKYYIKIAHLFAAIRTTINEEYIKEERREREGEREREYDDRQYDDEKYSDRVYDREYEEYYRNRYGGGSNPLGRLSLCGRRLVALLHKKRGKDGEYLAPQFCSSEYKNRIKTLDDELGIPELEALYNNLYEYDVSNKDWKKQFTGRDKKMDKEYKKDLTELYNQMTQNTGSLPAEIKSFKDVPLEMEKEVACTKTDDYKTLNSMFLYKRGDEIVENEFLAEYTAHIKKMEDDIQKKNSELIEILKTIFKKKTIDEESGETAEIGEDSYRIMIDPELTYVKLQEIVEKTRKIIVKLYLDCDKNYKKGIEIYVKMLGSKAVQESEEELKLFSPESDNIIIDTKDEYERERESERERERERESRRDYEYRVEPEKEVVKEYPEIKIRDDIREEKREEKREKREERDEYGFKKDIDYEKQREEDAEVEEYVQARRLLRKAKEEEQERKKEEIREKYRGGKNKTLKKQKNKQNKTRRN